MRKEFLLPLCAGLVMATGQAAPAEQEQAVSAEQLAAKLGSAAQDGDSSARVRVKIYRPGSEPEIYQVRIVSRRQGNASRVRYTVLWPNERKGEAFVLEQAGAAAAQGSIRASGGARSGLARSAALEPILGSDLAYQDAIENFFLWKNQALAGSDQAGGADCVILESKPAEQDSTPYGKVRSWIDPRKMVVMKVEKFDRAGRLVRRIETAGVAKDDLGRNVPASMTVRRTGSGTTTEIEGAGIRHDAAAADAEFDLGGS